MDFRERLLAALSWDEPDQVPFTTYDWFLPRGARERAIRDLGLSTIVRLPAHKVEHRQVTVDSLEYWDQGERYIRRTIKTPVGDVSQLVHPDSAYGSSWVLEHFIKSPEDYRVLEYYFNDMVFHNNDEAIAKTDDELGSDGLVMVRVAKGPIQEILYQLAGLERFSMDLADYPELVDSLYATMFKRWDEIYELAAKSPAQVFQAADNISSIVVGQERFRHYCMPCYERHSAILAAGGKRLFLVHMDGRLASIADLIAQSKFAIVEALTPAPMGDVSVAQARRLWPDKALWLNFTSSAHVESDEAIAAHTRQLIEEAGTRRGFAIGITEDVPYEHWAHSYAAIASVIREMR
jgi:hypothetical protein